MAYTATPNNLMYWDSVITRFEFTFEVAQSLLFRQRIEKDFVLLQ